ncbi:O-antigen ligase family protein [Chryseotalea sanaruensis]|nr:O-antigen ligase family protein [Chryseotalea sanaruensis]
MRNFISHIVTKRGHAIVSIAFGTLAFGVTSGKIIITVTGVFLVSLYAYLVKAKVSKQQLMDLAIVTTLFWIPCLWLIRSPDYTAGLKEIERFALFLVLPIVVTFVPLSKENLLTIARFACLVVISAYILSLGTAVYNYFYASHPWGIQSEFFFYTELSNGFFNAHPLYLSMAGFLAGMVSLVVFSDKPIFKWVILIFIGLVIILLNGRILISLYLSMVFLYSFSRIVAKNNKLYVVIGVVCSVAIVWGVIALSKIHDKPNRSYILDVNEAVEKSTNPEVTSQNNGLIVRFAIWRNAFNVIQNNVIWGNGTGSERQKLLQQYSNAGYTGLHREGLTSHNQLIFYLIEFGIVGTLAIMVAFGWMLIQAIRKNNWLYVCFIIFFVIASLTESYFNRFHGVALFSFVHSILFIKYVRNHQT